MQLNELIGRLRNVKRKQNGDYQAYCPAHEDNKPSLSVSAAENGNILLHCHAGCDFNSILTALNVSARDLCADRRKSARQIVATYDYQDEQGSVLYQVVREQPKGFKQRHLSKTGEWVWNMRDVRRVLYHLPDVLKAEQVLVCEGEKDCDAAAELSFTATCNVGGALKWRPEYAQHLKDKAVVIVPDADEPGRAHARQVASSLAGLARSIRLSELPGSKDLAEWVEKGGTREALAGWIESLPEYRPEPVVEFIFGKQGDIRALVANAITAISRAPELRDAIRYNEFSLLMEAARDLPWRRVSEPSPWTDVDDTRLAEWLQHHQTYVGARMAGDAALAVAHDNSYHPVREYLAQLAWDGTPRLERMLVEHAGADDTPYVRAVTAKWMISAVARIYRPGCQADYTLLLEAKQGKKKSSLFQVLAGSEWFTDHVSDLSSKDARQELHGVWIVELAELSAVRKTGDVEQVKAFLTARSDYFRQPYDRRPQHVPRTNVFAGTTNDASPFSDPTGNRRFWPVKISKVVDVDAIAAERDQLWAEARHRFDEHEPWWLVDEQLEKDAEQEQEKRYEPGPWDDTILAWIDNPRHRTKKEWNEQARSFEDIDDIDAPKPISTRDAVTIRDILVHAVGKDEKNIQRGDQLAVSRCLTHAGWNKSRDRWPSSTDNPVWLYKRPR